jgi:Uma2 family endonuclease
LQALDSALKPIVEVSTRVSDYSLPEPDIVVTDYKGPLVVPLETVALLVEVSDTTLKIDLGIKLQIYAKAGIPEYWVVDAEGAQIIRHWEPRDDGYAKRDETAFGTALESATLAGVVVETAGLR